MPTDESLQQRFEAAVDQLADSMYRVAYRLTGNAESASELVQESYLQAWQNLESLKDSEKMRSWMFAILRNQYSKYIRKQASWRPLTDQITNNLATANQSNTHLDDVVQAAVARLSEEQKLPLLLVSMEGLSASEAADVLGVPRGTVLSRMHRAREKLKQLLNTSIPTRDS